MVFLYDRHEVVTKFAFIGLILGGVPYLFKEVKDKTKESIDYRVMIITLVISLTLWIISNNVIKIDLDGAYNSYIISFLSLFLAGFIYSVGKVVPGISGAFLLIMIGMYEYILSIISNPLLITLNDIIKLIPFVLGFISGIIILLKLMSNLLNKHFKMFYSVIIGFVIGSVPALIPTSFLSINLIYGLLIMVFCFVLSYKLSK